MSATAAPTASDRSDFRTVVLGGVRTGVLTAFAVVVFLAAARLVPDMGVGGGALRSGVETLIVLAAGVVVTFFPARWSVARQVEGIAGAAAIGLVGTVVAWMGGIVTARQAARGDATLGRCAMPTVVGAVILATVARVAGLSFALPFATGVAFAIVLALLAVVALARKG